MVVQAFSFRYCDIFHIIGTNNVINPQKPVSASVSEPVETRFREAKRVSNKKILDATPSHIYISNKHCILRNDQRLVKKKFQQVGFHPQKPVSAEG